MPDIDRFAADQLDALPIAPGQTWTMMMDGIGLAGLTIELPH
jgi:hypothetical protein